MESDGLEGLLQSELAQACSHCREYVLALASFAPAIPAENVISRHLGYDNRQAMWRKLGAHGLPAPRVMTDWVRFLHLLIEYEGHGKPLIRQAWSGGVDSSVCYRASYRVARMSWRKATIKRSEYWITRFRQEVVARLSCTGQGAIEEPEA